MKDESELFRGSRFRIERAVQTDPQGRQHVREIVRHPGSVAIIPILDDGRVCLIENYRIAVDRRLLELPAGTREPDEDPLETARRELAEETGYRAGRIELLTSFYLSPGILDERMFLYLATRLEPGPAALEPGEDIALRTVPWHEALEMVRSGGIEDVKTLVGLLYYDRVYSSRSA
jgi:ADP-ribose pyrophosphatase